MATLYEIEQAMMECIDLETGEIDVERMEALEMERNQKIENIGCWIKNLKSDADAIRSEEKNLADRRRAMENKVESLKKYLSYILAGEKFKSPRVAVSWRKSKKVDIINEELIPEDYKTYTPSINKTAIKDAITSGAVVDGAVIIENNSIQIK